MKKIIAIILIISTLLVSVYADSTKLTDTQKTDLYNLGIMVGDENGDLRLNDSITRAEAIKIICTAGSITTDKPESNTFPDVADNHWAYKFVCAAKANKIIDGDENGNFNPEANITNEEIIKILVCLLGYGKYAEMNGGYPAGYMVAGARFGITTGLQLEVNTPATRNDVGVMICNSLDIPIMAESLSSDGNGEYIIMDGTGYNKEITLRNNINKTER